MHTNRLAAETSPYLLQHAHNPVDWYPWGPEALARARAEDRPILLSIGYSACHWCHVMERESFENDDIAALMNEHFVCVKVDREERPDIDVIYMQATLLLNRGQGGWPMTVFLTPSQEPFYAGTYFPPDDRYGRPGFARLLERIAEVWATEREALMEQAASLTDHLRQEAQAEPATGMGQDEIDAAVATLKQQFDPRWGGFGGAPKFPPHQALLLLTRHAHREGDDEARQIVIRTLDAMAAGGMHDHIGGGFCRYSVDERWMVPHFEKMLYDNGQLVQAYLEAGVAFGEPRYLETAREVLDYLLREMVSDAGGFYSATDADSEGEEGKFFVWTPAEVEAVLGARAARACVWFDIRPEGNFEGKSIPNTPRSLEEVAGLLGITEDDLARDVAAWREELYAARLKRVPPGLDDKVLVGWNALAIGAFAQGARILGEPRYLAAARRAADFIWNEMRAADGRLLRTWRAGRAHLDGVLEDYAYLCDALVELYEVDGDPVLLERARELAGRLLGDFVDGDSGALFSTSRDHEALLVRRRDGTDGATPNPGAVAAGALARLAVLLDEPEYRQAAVRALEAHGAVIRRFPRAFVRSLLVVDWLLDPPVELALVGDPAAESFAALDRAVAGQFVPHRVMARGDGVSASESPLLAGKVPVDGRAALYVCRDYACQAPVTDPDRVAAALSGVRATRSRALRGGA